MTSIEVKEVVEHPIKLRGNIKQLLRQSPFNRLYDN